MNPNFNVAILIIAMSLVTMLLRFLPFLIFSGKKQVPQIVLYLGDVLPSAVIGMLVIYCLRDISFTTAPFGLSELLASLVVVLVQIFRRNSILSILAGTISYMVLLQLI